MGTHWSRTEVDGLRWSARQIDAVLRPELTGSVVFVLPALRTLLINAFPRRGQLRRRACGRQRHTDDQGNSHQLNQQPPGGVGRAVSNGRPYPIYLPFLIVRNSQYAAMVKERSKQRR